MESTVSASPSKAFFVEMLTRDIELKDAILDLLDNCVDGILRQLKDNKGAKSPNPKVPYEGYWAKISANTEEFSIEDNCGGIRRDIAVEKAFRLGRPKSDRDRDKDIETIGMYGIGMKRAIFKMGAHSSIVSQHRGEAYSVKIPEEWLNADDDWNLPLVDLTDKRDGLDHDGTLITVKSLHPQIADQFDANRQPFLADLKTEIGNLFTLIIKKGFTVWLNDEIIKPISLDILIPSDWSQTPAIQPYACREVFDNVEINVAVGFYRELASSSDSESNLQIPRRTDNAGWTVICNERVVLHHDKTSMTGWGLNNVPKYHTQFIAIGGVVRFLCKNSFELPLNTTKRGLDTSTSIYWHTLSHMTTGLKKFTNFTNHWKGRESETKPYFEPMIPVDATQVANTIPPDLWRKARNSKAQRLSPNLPKPLTDDTTRRISFLRPSDEVATLGDFFFDNPKAPPGQIGIRCFDDALKKAMEEL